VGFFLSKKIGGLKLIGYICFVEKMRNMANDGGSPAKIPLAESPSSWRKTQRVFPTTGWNANPKLK
jgi:hypothetical protein